MKPCKHANFVTLFTPGVTQPHCLDCGKHLSFNEMAGAIMQPGIDQMIKKLEEEIAKEEKTGFGGKDYFLP